jgi:hypothetical protein
MGRMKFTIGIDRLRPKKINAFIAEVNFTGAGLLAAKQAGLEVIKKPGEGTYVGAVLFTYSGDKVITVDLQ